MLNVQGLLETTRLIRDGEKGVWRWRAREIIYLSLHCHHHIDSCIKITEGALFISTQLSIDAVGALRKVWVLI